MLLLAYRSSVHTCTLLLTDQTLTLCSRQTRNPYEVNGLPKSIVASTIRNAKVV